MAFAKGFTVVRQTNSTGFTSTGLSSVARAPLGVAVAAGGAAVALLAGCSGGTGVGAPVAANASAPADARRDAGLALLWDGDVAEEGVRRVETRETSPPAPSDCIARAFVADHVAAWRYPSGSVLLNYVAAVPRSGAETVRAAECTGQPLELEPQDRVDEQRAWCAPHEVAGTTCVVLLARKRVVSVLEVTAGDSERAEQAVRRLAPVAAQALARR